MANADKCYLNIPFKNYLRSLALAVDDDGRISRDQLLLAASREFENYKAIERRINDSGCSPGGGCCAALFLGSGTSTPTITDGNSSFIAAALGSAGDIAPTGFSTTLEAGAWSVSGQVIVNPTGTVTGHAQAFNNPSPGATQGGTIQGRTYVTAHSQDINVPFFGLVIQDSTWTPGVAVLNNLGADLAVVAMRFSAERWCDPCDYEIYDPG